MTLSKMKFLPAILAASVITLTSCEKDEMMETPGTMPSTESISLTNNGNRYIVTMKNGATATDEQIGQILPPQVLLLQPVRLLQPAQPQQLLVQRLPPVRLQQPARLLPQLPAQPAAIP